ncbi:hypothetical protein LR48_Vigan10g270800 [Vigna angularis]|uniref:Ferredoxin-thioredoxin reductase catalytic chain, chloroplastic n=1 Tax=Phaseolus angularis TaxID=3914 RepID=A0A0L9VP16_PHAAN|nr:hypothetical protein LR48_Vigan10g270800 [Vigna angularis]
MTTQASAFSLAAPSVATPFRRRHRNPLLVRAAVEPSDKSVEIMRKFSEQYARKSGTYFCVDKGVTSVVIKKLNFSFLLLDVHDFPVLNQDFPRKNLQQQRKDQEEAVDCWGNDSGIIIKVWDKCKEVDLWRRRDQGLADHKDSLGAPLCPCRHYDDKAAEAAQGFWNCPCVPMRERKECHCMLFLTPDNDFAGDEQAITLEEIKESTANM